MKPCEFHVLVGKKGLLTRVPALRTWKQDSDNKSQHLEITIYKYLLSTYVRLVTVELDDEVKVLSSDVTIFDSVQEYLDNLSESNRQNIEEEIKDAINKGWLSPELSIISGAVKPE